MAPLSKEARERLIIALTSRKVGNEVANAINSGGGGGGVPAGVVDWDNRSLLSVDGDVSVDWESKQLFGLLDTPTVDWGSTALYDDAQVLSIFWGDRTAYDDTGTVSVNWGTREVNFPSGNSAISWFNEGTVDILNGANLSMTGGALLNVSSIVNSADFSIGANFPGINNPGYNVSIAAGNSFGANAGSIDITAGMTGGSGNHGHLNLAAAGAVLNLQSNGDILIEAAGNGARSHGGDISFIAGQGGDAVAPSSTGGNLIFDTGIANGGFNGFAKFSIGAVEVMRLTDTRQFVVGATTAHASALVRFASTTKGFLPPSMSSLQKNAITTPSAGLVVYDNTLNKLCVHNGTAWETVTSA